MSAGLRHSVVMEVDITFLNKKSVLFFGLEVIRSKLMIYRKGQKDT